MTSPTVETSIVIRTLNESKHIEDLLKGIHAQNYDNWEIVLVDSGSTDGTPDIARRYGARVFHIPSDEFTFGRSLNIGCREAKGKYLVFASGHVWPITNNWLRNMIKPFDDSSVVMVYGRQRGTDANRLCEIRDLDVNYGRTSHILVDEANGNNGNAAIRRDLWLDQPFDESLPGLEDIDWARKAEKKEHRVYYTADAAVYHVHEESLPQVYRRHLREAIATKTMFPNYGLSWTGFLRALPYFIVRDVLYALRHHHRSKILHIPATRLAQFLGIYNGVRFHKQLARDLVEQLDIPKVHLRVMVDSAGGHSLREEQTPTPATGEVLVQVGYAGVRPGDVAMLARATEENANGNGRYSAALGREFAGVVVQEDRGTAGLRLGQKITGRFPVGCGNCPDCRSGDNFACSVKRPDDSGVGPGSYSPYIAVPSAHLYKLPPSLPLKFGAMVEPVAVCVEGLSRIGVQAGHKACVVGCGPMGNLCSQILRARGVQVTAVDKNPRRLALLFKHDIDTLDAVGKLDQYDYLIEGDGSGPALLDADVSVPSSKRLRVGLPYQLPDASSSLPPNSADVPCGSVAVRDESWREAIRLIDSGEISLDDHISEIEPLDAYSKVLSGIESGENFNVLLNVTPELSAL